jgi:copper chaperone
MHQLNISDMSCGHCVSAIEKAVKAVDPNAGVAVNLQARTASIESAFGADAFIAAISDAGYQASAIKSCCSGAA